ncbi:hypothetical protein TNIN_230071 [Trichonephila inaurata madagascariensis]|uniref:Uncharacterized protein n=1 Tax=Trichonephila inaurata madagascariensis TaxID=2747483 RepID=A0A8X6J5F3_9ARAC|nr:hypothetical protein TNIN_230071 [Trichonephila inaurata madagascariensis]
MFLYFPSKFLYWPTQSLQFGQQQDFVEIRMKLSKLLQQSKHRKIIQNVEILAHEPKESGQVMKKYPHSIVPSTSNFICGTIESVSMSLPDSLNIGLSDTVSWFVAQ